MKPNVLGSDMGQQTAEDTCFGITELQPADSIGQSRITLAVDLTLSVGGHGQGSGDDGEIAAGEADRVIGIGKEAEMGRGSCREMVASCTVQQTSEETC